MIIEEDMQRSVLAETIIKAAPDVVFDAWADPGELTRWWGDDEHYRVTRFESDLKPKGKWSAEGIFHSDGSPLNVEGEYLTVDRPFTLAFTWRESWAPYPMTMVELVFMRDLEGTLMKIRHVGDPDEKSAERHKDFWVQALSWLKARYEQIDPDPEPVFDLNAIAAARGFKLD